MFISTFKINCLFFFALLLAIQENSYAQELPEYLKDRGPGIPTSMFGTYIKKGELLLYPFFEYYYDN
ncbi:MAG: hypothetical protein ACM34J_09190, partial [Ignavibacteria bacterium]